MNLVIDIGNTQIKTAIFDGDSLIHRENFPNDLLLDMIRMWKSKYSLRRGILSHVSRIDDRVISELNEIIEVLALDHTLRLPFTNLYGTPHTLGVDRLALAAGAVNKYPGKNVLAIDAGSCITFDFVNSKSEYLGGAISPGIEMRYKAVNAFTANLPLLSPEVEIPSQGNSTENAIHRGILNGVVNEIDGTIAQYQEENLNLTVVLTGGDANFLANNIKSSIFAIPNFLLEGLNSILIHNIEE